LKLPPFSVASIEPLRLSKPGIAGRPAIAGDLAVFACGRRGGCGFRPRPDQVALDAVGLQGRESALPFGREVLQQAARRGVGQQFALRIGQRQALGQAGQRSADRAGGR
jgi:hypothetical protein